MRGAAAPQQQPRFRRLAAFQGVSAFGARGGGGGLGLGGDVSARYVRGAGALMKEARPGAGGRGRGGGRLSCFPGGGDLRHRSAGAGRAVGDGPRWLESLGLALC